MLLALQRAGRLTAAQLAAELEVSPRTVLRDVEALSEAGVPVFAVQGAGGGIHLLDTFRSGLATLTAEDAAALLLAGSTGLAAALGLEAAAASARRTLLASVPDQLVAEVTDVERWFLDDVPTCDIDVPVDVTRVIATALRSGYEVTLHAGGPPEHLRPLGLVRSGGRWFVVHLTDAGPQVRTLDGARSADVVQRPVPRPDDFDLAAFWDRTTNPGGERRVLHDQPGSA
jgi:predicted DNA-binding transcriptional regulator YafY